MAVMTFRGPFPALGVAAHFITVFPEELMNGEREAPVLWLLSDERRLSDYELLQGGLEALSKQFGIMIVIAEGLQSDYEDMKRGMNWFTYVSEALPNYLSGNFPVSRRPEDQVIFGFGMGGLGAIRTALRTGAFRAAGCCDSDLAPFSDIEAHRSAAYIHKMQTIYGEDWQSEEVLRESDPKCLFENAAEVPQMVLFSHEEAACRDTMRDFCSCAGERAVFHLLNGEERSAEILYRFLLDASLSGGGRFILFSR